MASDPGCGNPWEKEEEKKLRQLLIKYTDARMNEIAKLFPGRTPQSVKMHWESIKNNVVKGPWSRDEDELLTFSVKNFDPKIHKKKWSSISKYIPGRNGKQCRERWHNHLDPSVDKTPWRDEEEQLIMQLQAEHGNKWATIAARLKGRTDNQVKNHWYSRLKMKSVNKGKGRIIGQNKMKKKIPKKKAPKKKAPKKKAPKKKKRRKKKKLKTEEIIIPLNTGTFVGKKRKRKEKIVERKTPIEGNFARIQDPFHSGKPGPGLPMPLSSNRRYNTRSHTQKEDDDYPEVMQESPGFIRDFDDLDNVDREIRSDSEPTPNNRIMTNPFLGLYTPPNAKEYHQPFTPTPGQQFVLFSPETKDSDNNLVFSPDGPQIPWAQRSEFDQSMISPAQLFLPSNDVTPFGVGKKQESVDITPFGTRIATGTGNGDVEVAGKKPIRSAFKSPTAVIKTYGRKSALCKSPPSILKSNGIIKLTPSHGKKTYFFSPVRDPITPTPPPNKRRKLNNELGDDNFDIVNLDEDEEEGESEILNGLETDINEKTGLPRFRFIPTQNPLLSYLLREQLKENNPNYQGKGDMVIPLLDE